MRKLSFFISFLAAIVLSSCNENVPDLSYQANLALVEPEANLFFIADVEGLPGISKLNIQDHEEGISFDASRGNCNPGYDGYSSSVFLFDDDQKTSIKDVYSFTFRGKCPNCEWDDLIEPGVLKLGAIGVHDGVDLSLSFNNSLYYASASIPEADHQEDRVEISKLEVSGMTFPSHYIELSFDLTLKKLNSTEVIRLKNGVARLVTEDVP